MAKRIVNTFMVKYGNKYRLEIVDLAGQGSSLDHQFDLADPGFELSYNGDVNGYTRSVMSSSMSFTAYATPVVRDAVMDILYADREFSLACAVYAYDSNNNEFMEWCGIVLPDQTSETIEDGGNYVAITFQATDGLGILNSVNFIYPDTGNFYDGKRQLVWWLREALKKLPHYNYYFGAEAQVFMAEVGLPFPSSSSYSFQAGNSVLDACYVMARTFYGNRANNTQRRLSIGELEFSSTYNVIDDIMRSMGSTICLTKGKWWVMNKSFMAHKADEMDSASVVYFVNSSEAPFYETYSGNEDFVVDAEAAGLFFNVGATRTGVYPYRGATMTHKNGGSDLIYAVGIGYPYGSSDNDVLMQQPVFDRMTGFGGDPTDDRYDMANIGRGGNQPHVTSLNIASGEDGLINFTASGYINFELNGAVLDLFKSRYAIGAVPILRFIIRAVDSNGKEWRLKRHVQTLNSFRSQIYRSSLMEALGFNNLSGQNYYYPKNYEYNGAYEWIGDDDPSFSSTFFETMIAQDPSAIKEGTSERFLEVDYLNTKFYTPVKTEVKNNEEQSDNVLQVTHNKDRLAYLWQINSQLSMPALASGFISEMHIDRHQLLVYAPEAGPRPYGDGTYTFSSQPQWESSSEEGGDGFVDNTYYIPVDYILYGSTLRVGDGSETSDLQYVSFDSNNNGVEITDLGQTRIGSAYSNMATSTNGRIWARLFSGGVQLTEEEDNLSWSPQSDLTVNHDSLLYLNCEDLMNVRYRTRQMVSCSMYFNKQLEYFSMLRPINVIKTTSLRSSGVEYFLPASLNMNAGDYSSEMLLIGFDRDAVLGEVVGRGPGTHGSEGNPDGPGISDGSGDGPSVISNMIGRIAATEAVADLIQVTSPITDADLGGGTAEIDQLFPIFISKNQI